MSAPNHSWTTTWVLGMIGGPALGVFWLLGSYIVDAGETGLASLGSDLIFLLVGVLLAVPIGFVVGTLAGLSAILFGTLTAKFLGRSDIGIAVGALIAGAGLPAGLLNLQIGILEQGPRMIASAIFFGAAGATILVLEWNWSVFSRRWRWLIRALSETTPAR